MHRTGFAVYFDANREGGGGTNNNNNSQQQQQQNNSQQQSQQRDGQNNTQDNIDDLDGLWDNPSASGEGDNNQTQQQNNNNNNNNNQRSAAEVFETHLKELNFTKDVDTKKITDDLSNGESASLMDAINHAGRNAYRQALTTMNNLMERRLPQAVEEAVRKATGTTEGNMAVRTMNERLKFTKDPLHAPIAQTVLKRQIERGRTVDEAIESVRNYYARIRNINNKDFGGNMPPSSRPGNQRLNNSSRSDFEDDSDADSNWDDLLGGGS